MLKRCWSKSDGFWTIYNQNHIQSELQNKPWERAKDVGGLGGLNTSLERMGKVKQHTKTTGHDIHTVHPDYASILQTAIKTKGKRLFLESLHSFLDKISPNERASFPRVYASLVSSLRANIDVYLYVFAIYLHSLTCRIHFSEEHCRRRPKLQI